MRLRFAATWWSPFGQNDKAFVVFLDEGVGSGAADPIILQA
jgi:hypothetical protein